MEKWADLRKRAGLDPITSIYGQVSTEELIQLCRKERQIELAFERHRYFDTRTWMIATQTDNGKMYGMNTSCPLDAGMKELKPPTVSGRERLLKPVSSKTSIISILSLSENWIATSC